MIKKYVLLPALISVLTSYVLYTNLWAHSNILNIPIIIQKGTYHGHKVHELCGATCAEMILKYYGVDGITRVDIAEKFCSELYPAYNKKMKYDKQQKKKYSTGCERSLLKGGQFSGTNTHVLELYFISLGFKTDRKRTAYNKKTGAIAQERFTLLLNHLRQGHPTVIHVEKHYMLAIGYDDVKRVLYINDPSDPKMLAVKFNRFINRNNTWRPKKPKNKGWDGRYVAVWQ